MFAGSKFLVPVLVALNGLVLANALFHGPRWGYDAREHLRYVDALARGSLPTKAESREFFSPPAPYVLPALVRAVGIDRAHAAKSAQLLNALLSVGLCLYLARLARSIRPGSRHFPALCVGMLALFPVYYKSFAQVRGEPLVAFCAIAIVYHAVPILSGARDSLSARLLLGGLCGLALLARQWSVFVVAACVFFGCLLALREPARRLEIARALGTVLALAILVSGWFYVGLHVEHGSAVAFNRAGGLGAIPSKPAAFYLGIGGDALFSAPVKPALKNQALGIFYSEVWGDYWNYFSSRDPAYLGRVNLASLFPSAFFLVATVWGLVAAARRVDARLLMALVVALSWAGYLGFVLSYPTRDGDTVKATYLLHIFPIVALFGADLLERLGARRPRVAWAVGIGLAAVFVHNLGAVVTGH